LTFGVPSSECGRNDRPEHDSTSLYAVVARAAENLVAELERACDRTGKWSDQALTEALVDAALSTCLDALARTGCCGEANRMPSGELWRIAGKLLEAGTLQVHARFKPRGYAGDYQLLHRIWGEDHCDHPLGIAFDRYFLRQAAPQAVRSRTREIGSALAADCLSVRARPTGS
jgi:hypothetical protein